MSSQQANVEASVDVQRDAGIGIGAVSPMHGAVGIPQGEGELGVPLEVETVDGDLARIRDWCGEQGPREQKEEEKKGKVFHNSIRD